MILSLITKRVHPSLRHLVSEDATFHELRLNPVDGWGIAVDIEEEIGRELDWSRVERWASVADVIATVRDSDASLAEDAKRLSPEGVAARAAGIAQNNPGEPVS